MITGLLLAASASLAQEPKDTAKELASLRALILAADCIAIVVPGPTTGDLDSRQTILTLEKALKGDLEEEKLVVHSWPPLSQPLDAPFVEGRRMLVFLELDAGVWRTCARGSGAKKLSDEAMLAYEARIREFFLLGQLKPRPARDQAELDWIVSLTLDPITRWEGACDLRSAVTGFADRLSPAQRAGLLDALLAAPQRDAGSQELFELFRTVADERLLPWMLSCLEAEAADPLANDAAAIAWASERLADPELSGWVQATWPATGSSAQPVLTFQGKAQTAELRQAEETAAVLEFVRRGREILAKRPAR